jgi:hypothetical protein
MTRILSPAVVCSFPVPPRALSTADNRQRLWAGLPLIALDPSMVVRACSADVRSSLPLLQYAWSGRAPSQR